MGKGLAAWAKKIEKADEEYREEWDKEHGIEPAEEKEPKRYAPEEQTDWSTGADTHWTR